MLQYYIMVLYGLMLYKKNLVKIFCFTYYYFFGFSLFRDFAASATILSFYIHRLSWVDENTI